MGYQVIARKYRPQRFADVVGQEHVTQTLANAIRQNRIAHAYLFCGPRGTGKTTVARIFAKALNCTGGPHADFDVADPRCVEIAEGRSLDVLEIDGASNNGVEQVRELRDTVRFAPASSLYKIYIIDEVHMLSTAAFNALLKTLEEPPAHVKFMFATTDPEKVLPTILSRCQRFDLRRIPSALIVQHLRHIAALEQVEVAEPALFAIARGADGGMRDAESTLDQLISFCGNHIVEADVLSMFGLAAQAEILELAGALLAGEINPALRHLDQLLRQGKDLGRLVADLLHHYRNLLLFKVSGGDLSCIECSETEAAALREQAAGVETPALSRMLEVLSQCEGRLRDAASKRILVEIALLKTIEARNAVSIDEVLGRLGQLRSDDPVATPPAASGFSTSRSTGTTPSKRATAGATPKPDAPAATGAQEAPVADTAGLKPGSLDEIWAQVVEGVGRISPFAKSYLLEAHPASLTNGVLTIGFDPEVAHHLEFVDTPRNRELIQTKFKELGSPDLQIRFAKIPRPAGAERRPTTPAPETPPKAPEAPARPATPPAATPAALARTGSEPAKPEPRPFNKEEFKNDPLIQKALEVFKGRIVEVRS